MIVADLGSYRIHCVANYLRGINTEGICKRYENNSEQKPVAVAEQIFVE